MLVESKGKQINIELKYYDDKYYKAEAFSEDGEVMGVITFKPDGRGSMWLQYIATNEKFQNMGVGDALLSVMEYRAVTTRIRNIEGKFYPSNDKAKPFYENRGYNIYKDGYETYLDKSLNIAQVISETEPRITNYEVTQVPREAQSEM
ncbi:MAG: GNAT family N-acetyltransferase [Clostridiales bacterium]|nr:GNAT family N-acetyltransferase [Clostridiales bacterium]